MAEAGMRTYLRDVIGVADVTTGGDVTGRRLAVQAEGLRIIDDFLEFDEDGISTLCQSVRKPGGTILVGGNRVADPGFSIPAIAEKRMKYGTHLAKMY